MYRAAKRPPAPKGPNTGPMSLLSSSPIVGRTPVPLDGAWFSSSRAPPTGAASSSSLGGASEREGVAARPIGPPLNVSRRERVQQVGRSDEPAGLTMTKGGGREDVTGSTGLAAAGGGNSLGQRSVTDPGRQGTSIPGQSRVSLAEEAASDARADADGGWPTTPSTVVVNPLFVRVHPDRVNGQLPESTGADAP
jgi:hypothetical protein